jgi:UDP-N-acetylmuramyl pentapeptide phosphotransferase/UDP-N-acetylglucosamine-1-phosphate transferase
MLLFVLKHLAPVFAISLALCFVLVKFPLVRLMDKAGERSLHEGVIPRSGGIAILLALVCGFVLAPASVQDLLSLPVIAALLAMCAVSLADDVFALPPGLRLVMQLLIAAFIVFFAKLFFTFGDILPLWLAQGLTLLGMVWMVNLYNFMDGMDGFASGMAIIAFSTLAYIGLHQHDMDYAMLNTVLITAVAGFWCFNFPPARIFMGDIGSTSMGLLAAAISLLGWQRGLFPLWVPAVLFSPFWIDATYTVLKRMARGERFWLAHRSHFYQRLVLSGLSHRQVVLAEYALMLAGAASVVLPVWLGLGYNWLIPILWLGVYGVMLPLLERHLAMHRNR